MWVCLIASFIPYATLFLGANLKCLRNLEPTANPSRFYVQTVSFELRDFLMQTLIQLKIWVRHNSSFPIPCLQDLLASPCQCDRWLHDHHPAPNHHQSLPNFLSKVFAWKPWPSEKGNNMQQSNLSLRNSYLFCLPQGVNIIWSWMMQLKPWRPKVGFAKKKRKKV